MFPARRCVARLLAALIICTLAGCQIGPKALERTHGRYNEALKRVNEEQLLLNVVRARYNDNVTRIDVSGIASQYEVDASVEARPFFTTDAAQVVETFSRILPFASASWSNRPTISLTPLDDPDTIRGFMVPNTLDGIIFLAESSYPIDTVFSLFIEYINHVPNAVSASGPPRRVIPEYSEFRRIVEILQSLADRGDLRFIRHEKITEVGTPIPDNAVSAGSMIEAAKNDHEYRQKGDKTWILIRKDRKLDLKINPKVVDDHDVRELCRLLRIQPGLASYEVTVGSPEQPFAAKEPLVNSNTITLYPRSTLQAMYYMSHGVIPPPEHQREDIVKTPVLANGEVFDWQQVTSGIMTIQHVKQHHPPKCASVAIPYRGYWFYIDDHDHDSKTTFSLMMLMSRVGMLGAKKGGPTLTLPVGR